MFSYFSQFKIGQSVDYLRKISAVLPLKTTFKETSFSSTLVGKTSELCLVDVLITLVVSHWVFWIFVDGNKVISI